MEPTEPTRRKLEAMTVAFAPDNNRRNIEWSKDLRFFGVAKDDENIAITPYHAKMMDLDIPRSTEFNLLVNTTSHEVEHTVVDTTIIKDFVEHYDKRENMASVVMNTLEDVFIDRRRTNRKRGLRPIQAQFAKFYVESKEPVHQEDPANMFVATFRQIALAGYAKGLGDADDDVQEFAARVRPLIQEVRKTHSTEGRKEIGHQVMEILDEYVDADDIEETEYATAPIGMTVEEAEDGDEEADASAEADEDGDEEEEEDQDGEGGGSGGDEDEEGDEGEGSGDEQEDEDGDGEGGDGSSEHGEIEDSVTGETVDVDAELQEMEDGDAGDWHDVPEGQDYTEVPDWVEDKMNTIRSKERERQTEIGKRKAERDERIEQNKDSYGIDSSEVEDKYDGEFARAVKEAFRQIKTRDRPTPTERGSKLRTRGFVRRTAGDRTERDLFLEDKPSEAGDRCITVAVDGSGSMDEMDAKLALRALAHATELIGDRFAAVEFHESGGVQTDIITAPDETFKTDHLDSFATGGHTPTAHGIMDARSVADAAPNSEDVIMVVTDGAANVDLDSSGRNRNAMEDASAQVNAARAEGKRVIGVGVGGGVTPDYMQSIFGQNYVMVDMENLSSKLLEIYRGQMDTV